MGWSFWNDTTSPIIRHQESGAHCKASQCKPEIDFCLKNARGAIVTLESAIVSKCRASVIFNSWGRTMTIFEALGLKFPQDACRPIRW